jgi:hypothetical protein
MTEQTERQKEKELAITDELAKQAKQEPGSAEEEESKNRRAKAEKEFRDVE